MEVYGQYTLFFGWPTNWAIATSEFRVPWTNYFDDFVTVADCNEQVSVDASVRFLLKSLGWRFAESGDKAPPFSGMVNTLGVSIDLQWVEEKFYLTILQTESW